MTWVEITHWLFVAHHPRITDQIWCDIAYCYLQLELSVHIAPASFVTNRRRTIKKASLPNPVKSALNSILINILVPVDTTAIAVGINNAHAVLNQ